MRFCNKTAIVTGAGSGIGLATAKLFYSEGANVALVDIVPDDISKVSEELSRSTGGRAMPVICDVGDNKAVSDTVRHVIECFGGLDIIINNAGIMSFKSLVELEESDWLSVLRVDLLGAFFFTKEGFKNMKPGSAIINVASIHAVETTPLVAPYAAAKAAMVSLTNSAAIEGKKLGIRTSAVLPGAIDTPMLTNNPNIKAGLETIGRNDVGTPEELAECIAFLASPKASFVSGAALVVDGGRLPRL